MPSATKVQTGYLEAVNPFTLASGTASAPIISFSNSPATGIFSPSTGALAFSTGSTQNALTILSGGNVGVGIANPGATLEVAQNGSGSNTVARFRRNNNLDQHILDITVNPDTDTVKLISTGSANGSIILGTLAVDALTTTNSGNIGIGTTNPTYKLDVEGGSNITTQLSLWGRTIGQPQTLVEPGRIYATAAGLGPGNLLLQPTGGNVGIGTTNPIRKLSIYDSTPSAAATTDFILWSDGTRTSTLNQTGSSYSYAGVGSNEMWYYSNGSYSAITLGSDGSIPIKFVSGGGERLRITGAGNVGIGVTNPSVRLEVKSQINVIDPSNNIIQGLTGTAFGYSPGSYPVLQVGGGSYRTVSIGHDPSSNTNSTFTGSGIEVIFKNGVRFMTPNDANTSWNLSTLCMKDGNVGIGNTNPSAKLHVSGNIIAAVAGGSGVLWTTYGALSSSQVSSYNNNLIGYNIRGWLNYIDGGSSNNNFYATNTASYGFSGIEQAYGGFINFYTCNSIYQSTTVNTTVTPRLAAVVNPGGLLECKYGYTTPAGYSYYNQYTTDSSWGNTWVTVIPPTSLTSARTYIVSFAWNYNGAGGMPYYLNGACLFTTVYGTNGGGVENAITILSTTHTGGSTFYLEARSISGSGGGQGGVQVKITGFNPVNGSFIRVYAQEVGYHT
jgi:hypothetical protein